jgi:hypothetical protein
VEAGRVAAELHQKESGIYMSNLEPRLEEIDKKKNTPPFIPCQW